MVQITSLLYFSVLSILQTSESISKCVGSNARLVMENKLLKQGEEVILKCFVDVKYPENCKSEIVWINHNQNLSIKVSPLQSCTFLNERDSVDDRLSVECLGNQYKLTIRNVNAYEHAGTWSCGTGVNAFSSIKKLEVCCPPSKPYLYNEAFGDLFKSISPRIPIIRILLNSYYRIVCNAYHETAVLKYPVLPINYTWFRIINGGTYHPVYHEVITKIGPTGFAASEVSKSALGSSGKFVCKAHNRYGYAESEPTDIDILGSYLKPNTVNIKLSANPIDVDELLIITCSAKGGSPPPILIPDGPFKFKAINYSMDVDSYFVYSTKVHKHADNHALWCKAAENVGILSPSITVRVNYPPSLVRLTSPTVPLQAYRSFSSLSVQKNVIAARLRCQTDKTSHPSNVDILWRKWPPGESIPRIIGGATVSLQDGTVTSTLEINMNSADTSAEYRCTVQYRGKDILRSEIVIISPNQYNASTRVLPSLRSIILLTVIIACLFSIFSCAINILAFIKSQERKDGLIDRAFNFFERVQVSFGRKFAGRLRNSIEKPMSKKRLLLTDDNFSSNPTIHSRNNVSIIEHI